MITTIERIDILITVERIDILITEGIIHVQLGNTKVGISRLRKARELLRPMVEIAHLGK